VQAEPLSAPALLKGAFLPLGRVAGDELAWRGSFDRPSDRSLRAARDELGAALGTCHGSGSSNRVASLSLGNVAVNELHKHLADVWWKLPDPVDLL
jgi:hypothetical protein